MQFFSVFFFLHFFNFKIFLNHYLSFIFFFTQTNRKTDTRYVTNSKSAEASLIREKGGNPVSVYKEIIKTINEFFFSYIFSILKFFNHFLSFITFFFPLTQNKHKNVHKTMTKDNTYLHKLR